MRARDKRILDIVTRQQIGTQSALVRALRRAGIRVTQATISRDIRRLGLVKVPTGDGAYRYQASGPARPPAGEVEARLLRAFQEYVEDIREGSGLVLVQTASGSAGTVAEAIDEMEWREVAGTVAGDNTIIVVPRRPADRATVTKRLRGLL